MITARELAARYPRRDYNPVAERAAKRRAEWERERLAKVKRLLDAGLLTEAEAKERGV